MKFALISLFVYFLIINIRKNKSENESSGHFFYNPTKYIGLGIISLIIVFCLRALIKKYTYVFPGWILGFSDVCIIILIVAVMIHTVMMLRMK